MRSLSAIFFGSILALAALAYAQAPADSGFVTVSDEEILDELKSAPRDNHERVARLKELYIQAGARDGDITLQEVKASADDPAPLSNVIVVKPGKSDDTIVVGGHLDKVTAGDGIVDDWSGACLASNLYQTIRGMETHHTFVFIGFAHEEIGLVGSRRYVDSLSEAEHGRIKAMLNLECLGIDDPFIWTNGSTDGLELIAHEVAARHKLPLRDHKIVGVGADSIPFDRVGIPNITFDGMAVENFRFIHSPLDTFDAIKPRSYLNAYRLASQFLVTLDRDLAAAPDLLARLDPKVAAQKVDEYIAAELEKRHIPGLSVAVVRRGEVLHAKGYGMSNVELSVPANADTVYQIGSITKQFTATAIMMLAEDGLLALDDPISKFIDNSPEAWESVTVRHLLNHTSGIKSYTSIRDNMAKNRLDRSKDEVIGTVRDLPLEFSPGDKFAYSNSGYFLLGVIIEKVSGKSYSEFLDERIFKPLRMTATRVNDLKPIIKNRATGYAWFGQLQNAEHSSMTWPYSAGAIVSTVSDLAKWDAALHSGRAVKQTVLDAMWTKCTLSNGTRIDYGFGWSIGNYRGHRFVGHGGGISGFTTDITRFLDDQLTVVVLTNLSAATANPGSLARGIAAFYIRDFAAETKTVEE